MKLLLLPIVTLLLTSYLLSKIPNEKTQNTSPKKAVTKSVEVQRESNSVQTEAKFEVIPNRRVAGNYLGLNTVQSLVKEQADRLFGSSHWQALHILIMKESSWNPNAVNKSSGACGLFQAYPCAKMGGMELSNQIEWGLSYIKQRYGNPSQALAFHYRKGWY